MPRINVLPKSIAELIAAGEVIERPSSVIKELVENSIDAGASSITVEIQNGGTTFMRVSDNGCGIEAADVRNAFLRHATSKIRIADDLDAIGTLGFRGEALASVSAVSKVEVITKNAADDTGTRYVTEGGEEKVFEPAGCPEGTTIIVRDIFYNVPARMKFLKKDVSEGNSVSSLMDRIALSHPEVSFTFIRDGRQTLRTQGDGKLSTAVYQVFGKGFFDSLLEVDYELDGIHVDGFVTKPVSSAKANRSMQIFYINGRYVRTKTGMAALEQAYRGSIMTGKFPSCVLRLTMNCSMLDVNVHPAKLEVRFTNEKPVYESVYHAVRSAVMEHDSRSTSAVFKDAQAVDPKIISKPVDRGSQMSFSFPAAKQAQGYYVGQKFPDALERRSAEKQAASAKTSLLTGAKVRDVTTFAPGREEAEEIRPDYDMAALLDSAAPEASNSRGTAKTPIEAPAAAAAPEEDEGELLFDAVPGQAPSQEDVSTPNNDIADIVDESDLPPSFRLIGQAFSTYIILEYDGDRLMFIDKHAAHERLLYEKLKAGKEGMAPQYLLEPVSVTLEAEECRIVLENRELLADAGFEVDQFGEKTIIVRSVPVLMEKLDVAAEFSEIAEYLSRHKKLILSEKMDWIIANTACRAAIKAGNRSTDEELIELASQLERDPELRTCPHGRPIYFLMTKYEIEKAFKRIV